MAKNSNDGGVNHYGLVRLRIAGSGSLRMTFYSLDAVKSYSVAALVMADPNNVMPTKLANFTQQRAQLELKTTGYGETFHCSQITIFAKHVAASLPQASN